jgi:adenosylcobinamide kinase/adenosylcobinamide-phosphate guanylyltransferase
MTIFLSGGAKNGKSSLAQDLAVRISGDRPRYYVATMIPVDEEDRCRIRRHVADRSGLDFQTVECGRNILSCLEGLDRRGTFLLDSVTALLMNEMFSDDGDVDFLAGGRCASDLTAFISAVENAVIVSDAIYADAARYDEITELYRASLAEADRACARACDTVIEMVAGQPIIYKGGLPE